MQDAVSKPTIGRLEEILNFQEEAVSADEREMSLEFAKRMLRWLPEERASAKDLLSDPWLRNST
jgi:hypothetical protein